jgi:hypothetical protein
MDKGRVIFDGDTETAIDVYRDSLIEKNREMADGLRAGTGEVRLTHVELLDVRGENQHEVNVGDFVRLRLHYVAQQRIASPIFNVAIFVMNGHPVTGIRTDVDGMRLDAVEGEGHIDLEIPNMNLLPNVYTIDAAVFHPDGVTFYDRINTGATFKIRGGLPVNGTTYLPHTWRTRAADVARRVAMR